MIVFREGEDLSAAKFNRLAESLGAHGHVSPGDVRISGHDGPLRPKSFFAKLTTENAGPKYDWIETRHDGSGWVDGPEVGVKAVPIGGETGLVGKRVRLYPDGFDGYTFQFARNRDMITIYDSDCCPDSRLPRTIYITCKYGTYAATYRSCSVLSGATGWYTECHEVGEFCTVINDTDNNCTIHSSHPYSLMLAFLPAICKVVFCPFFNGVAALYAPCEVNACSDTYFSVFNYDADNCDVASICWADLNASSVITDIAALIDETDHDCDTPSWDFEMNDDVIIALIAGGVVQYLFETGDTFTVSP